MDLYDAHAAAAILAKRMEDFGSGRLDRSKAVSIASRWVNLACGSSNSYSRDHVLADLQSTLDGFQSVEIEAYTSMVWQTYGDVRSSYAGARQCSA